MCLCLAVCLDYIEGEEISEAQFASVIGDSPKVQSLLLILMSHSSDLKSWCASHVFIKNFLLLSQCIFFLIFFSVLFWKKENLVNVFSGLRTLLRLACRVPVTQLKKEVFEEDLVALKIPAEFVPDFSKAVFGSRSELL